MLKPRPVFRLDNRFHPPLKVFGAGAGAIFLSGAVAAYILNKSGAGAGALTLGGTANGVVRKFGSGSATITLTGSNTVKEGSGSGAITFSGVASAVHRKFGSGAGAITLGGGNIIKTATGSASISLSGSGNAVLRKFGSGSAALTLSSTPANYILHKFGSGSGAIALSGTGNGVLRKFGGGSGSLFLSGSGTGSVILAVSVTVDDANPSASGAGNGPFTTGNVTATPHDGHPGFSHSWTRISGDAAITAGSASSATTNFSASGTAPETKVAAFRDTVTDSIGATATIDVTVTIEFTGSPLSATASPTLVQGSRLGSGTVTTTSTTVTPSGGTGPYTYAWEYVSGDASIVCNSPTSATTVFHRSGTPINDYIGTWRCKVTDNLGATAYADNVDAECIFET